MAKRQQQQQSQRQKKTATVATAKELDERSLVEKNENPCVVFVLLLFLVFSYDFSSSHQISFLSAVTTVFFLSALLFADALLLLLLLLPCSRRSFRVGFEKTGS
jgi:hypothetical protein